LYDYIEKNKLNETIINFIIEFIYEFCSDKFGYDIEVTSYKDFCNKFWKIKEIRIREWYYNLRFIILKIIG
jgi:hypothetical protein